jgi:ectoine hydroxylase-related dioxygenase (phytanoyl-CoA dioxygenase family)
MQTLANRFAADTSDAEISEALLRDGYAIIEGMLGIADLNTLKSEIAPYLSAATSDSGNEFMGDRTVRFGRLIYLIPKVREMVIHPKVTAACKAVLTTNFPTYQLHFSGVMHVQGGAKAQVLHRDTVLFTNPSPPTVLATMWAAQDFTRENGATVFVPGSHLWPEDRIPQRKELACAEMPAGSVLLYLGNVIHGAGRCEAGRERMGVSLQYSVGWMRQEENQYLATPLSYARGLPEDVQRVIGYDLAARHWGYVGQHHPMDFLTRDSNVGTLDPEGYNFPGGFRGMTATLDKEPTHPYYSVTLDD